MMKRLVFWMPVLLLGGFLLLQTGCAGSSGSYYRSYDDDYWYPYDRYYRYPYGSPYWQPYGYYPYRDFDYRYVPRYRYKRDRHFGRPPRDLPDRKRRPPSPRRPTGPRFDWPKTR